MRAVEERALPTSIAKRRQDDGPRALRRTSGGIAAHLGASGNGRVEKVCAVEGQRLRLSVKGWNNSGD